MGNVKEFAQELASNGVNVSFVGVPEPAPRMRYKNIEMEQMLVALEKHLGRTDVIGYAAARNTRILKAEAQEYFDLREKLVNEYGEMELDDDGNPTGCVSLKFSSPSFPKYSEEIQEWAEIEHEPCVFTISEDEVIGKLSGTEILEISWMIEGWE